MQVDRNFQNFKAGLESLFFGQRRRLRILTQLLYVADHSVSDVSGLAQVEFSDGLTIALL